MLGLFETIKDIGSVVGLCTGVFLVLDRLLRKRPLFHLAISDDKTPAIRIRNVVDETVIVDHFEIKPPVLYPRLGNDLAEFVRASIRLSGIAAVDDTGIRIVSKPLGEDVLPLVRGKGFDDLKNEDAIHISARWRTTSWSWWPWTTHVQIKVTAGDIRAFEDAD